MGQNNHEKNLITLMSIAIDEEDLEITGSLIAELQSLMKKGRVEQTFGTRNL